MSKGERHPMRTVIRLCAAILVSLALTVAGYVVYLNVNYTRIADGIEVSNEGAEPKTAALAKGVTYTALTYNVGFGAYTPDFSFFMEEGTMKDGTPTQGEHGVAASKESVLACTEGDIATITATTADGAPDLVLLQEVDRDSTRSHHVDQCQAFKEALPTYGAFYAENFHCGYLLYPFPEFHGSVHGGLLTLSDVQGSAVRRSYPIDESFPARFFDLDRCFLVQRVAVEDGHELVVINSHMSAYDEGGVIRAQQMALVMGVLREEAAKGNYVIAGGDWNHALCDSQELYASEQAVPEWISTFDESELPEGFSVVRPDNLEEVATCRGSDLPYVEGVSYRVTCDGFIVSSNVQAVATTIDTGYATSDHNPVLLMFTLA